MHIFRLAPIFREGRAPLRPLAGGEGGTRRGSDGRVRWAAPLFGTRRSPTSPQPSPPRRRGGYFGHLPGCEICACPSAKAGVQESRGTNQRPLDPRFSGDDESTCSEVIGRIGGQVFSTFQMKSAGAMITPVTFLR